jgi:hypothetical protein
MRTASEVCSKRQEAEGRGQEEEGKRQEAEGKRKKEKGRRERTATELFRRSIGPNSLGYSYRC